MIAAGLGVVGALLFVVGAGRLRRAKPLTGSVGTLGGGLTMSLGAVAGLFGVNLQSYDRLTYEQPVARVAIAALGADRYTVEVTPAGEDAQTAAYEVAGDEWRLEARVLTFHPWANVAGLDTVYRLERLDGRYTDVAAENAAANTAHALAEPAGLDVRRLREVPVLKDHRPVEDARFGSGVYLPMADGATFEVTISQKGGLMARPTNDTATRAVEAWTP